MTYFGAHSTPCFVPLRALDVKVPEPFLDGVACWTPLSFILRSIVTFVRLRIQKEAFRFRIGTPLRPQSEPSRLQKDNPEAPAGGLAREGMFLRTFIGQQ